MRTISPFGRFGRGALERNPPLFKADSVNLAVSASKDGKLRVVYGGWDESSRPSQPVPPLWAMSDLQKIARHYRELLR
jgi:hypothetical protein